MNVEGSANMKVSGENHCDAFRQANIASGSRSGRALAEGGNAVINNAN